MLFAHKVELSGAARAGARWAAIHPRAYDPVAAPGSNSIEGQVQGAGGTSAVALADITIEYFPLIGSPPVPGPRCGLVSSGVYTPLASQSTCIVDGNLVKVTVTGHYPVVSRLFAGIAGGNVSVTVAAVMVITG